MKFKLPEKPIDKYKIEWWSISVYSNDYYLYHKCAIYYVNSPYNLQEFGIRNESTGVTPLVDSWMIYELTNDKWHPLGRWDGWDSPNNYNHPDSFPTKEQATQEILKRLNVYLAEATKTITTLKKLINEVTTDSKPEIPLIYQNTPDIKPLEIKIKP
jgi:hypothetical protein